MKQQVKNPERVSIFIDGKYSFSLSLDELVAHKLKKDQELSAEEVKKFKKISADGKLRTRALEWLMNRPHSEREFRDYLFRKKTEKDQIESLVNEFIEKGYLDDTKFAVWFSELQARRGKSDRAIRVELYKKGIRDTVDQILVATAGDEAERLKAVVAKKRKLLRYQNDPQKLAKYLTSQGFSWPLVKKELLDSQPGD